MATFWADDTTTYTEVWKPNGESLVSTVELGTPLSTDDPHVIELLSDNPGLENRAGRKDFDGDMVGYDSASVRTALV